MRGQAGVVERVVVVGPPGAGKSWVARRLAEIHNLPHFELDRFKLKPNRQLASPEEFEQGLGVALVGARWVLDGNWEDARLAAEVWPLADLIVRVDYPRRLVLYQLAWRSLRRWMTRERYYGWSQQLGDWLSLSRWTWKMVPGYRQRYLPMEERLATGLVVVLTSRAQARRFVELSDQG